MTKTTTSRVGVKVIRSLPVKHICVCRFIFLILCTWAVSNDPAKAQTLSGTSIVAIRYHDAVFIGADSKTIRGYRDVIRIPLYGCKIHILNSSLVFAQSGLEQSGTGFDIPAIAKRAADSRSTFSGVVKAFGDSAIKDIRDEMIRKAIQDSMRFISEYANREVFSILFIGVEDSVIRMHKQTYFVQCGNDSIVIIRQRKDAPLRDGYVEFLGGTPFLRDSLSIENLLMLGPVYTINTLIGLDAVFSPTTISPPIDILFFTAHEPRWLQKKAECE